MGHVALDEIALYIQTIGFLRLSIPQQRPSFIGHYYWGAEGLPDAEPVSLRISGRPPSQNSPKVGHSL